MQIDILLSRWRPHLSNNVAGFDAKMLTIPVFLKRWGAQKNRKFGQKKLKSLMLRLSFLYATLCILFLSCEPLLAADDEPSFLSLGPGYYDIFSSNDKAVEFRMEYRNNLRFLIFKPFTGVAVTSKQAVFTYAGIYSDYYFGRRIVVQPSVAPGYYYKGDGKDLGHEFEIKSGLEIAYRMNDRSRIGIHFYHISNAGLEDTKRGVEVLGTSYSIPLN